MVSWAEWKMIFRISFLQRWKKKSHCQTKKSILSLLDSFPSQISQFNGHELMIINSSFGSYRSTGKRTTGPYWWWLWSDAFLSMARNLLKCQHSNRTIQTRMEKQTSEWTKQMETVIVCETFKRNDPMKCNCSLVGNTRLTWAWWTNISNWNDSVTRLDLSPSRRPGPPTGISRKEMSILF